jgi:hypothetical protein
MLRSLDELDNGFSKVLKKSRKKCGDKLEEIRKLTFVSGDFFSSYWAFRRKHQREIAWGHALHHALLLELFRTSGKILYLSSHGLYRNAYDEIRHALESFIQAIYIDNRHPKSSLVTKVEILKEVEGRREYRAQSLIHQLVIGHKDKLDQQYKELSGKIHPSHKEIVTVLRDIRRNQREPVTVDCDEITNIYESMIKMYDILFFLVFSHYPRLRNQMKKDKKFIAKVGLYRLNLVAEAIGVRARAKKNMLTNKNTNTKKNNNPQVSCLNYLQNIKQHGSINIRLDFESTLILTQPR